MNSIYLNFVNIVLDGCYWDFKYALDKNVSALQNVYIKVKTAHFVTFDLDLHWQQLQLLLQKVL